MEEQYVGVLAIVGYSSLEIRLLADQLRRFWHHLLVQNRTVPVPGIDDDDLDGKPFQSERDTGPYADMAKYTFQSFREHPGWKGKTDEEVACEVKAWRINFERACHAPEGVNDWPTTEEERFLWRLWRDQAHGRYAAAKIMAAGKNVSFTALWKELEHFRRVDESRIHNLDGPA